MFSDVEYSFGGNRSSRVDSFACGPKKMFVAVLFFAGMHFIYTEWVQAVLQWGYFKLKKIIIEEN